MVRFIIFNSVLILFSDHEIVTMPQPCVSMHLYMPNLFLLNETCKLEDGERLWHDMTNYTCRKGEVMSCRDTAIFVLMR